MDRTAVVTGASTGIGRATARALRDEGFRVWAGARRDEDLDAVADEGLEPLRLDVTNAEDVASAAAAVGAETSGRLGVLVNNAGITVARPLEELSDDDLLRQFDVNLFGLHRVTRAFLPHLRAARGRIVQISSNSGRMAAPFTGAYVASKYAVEGYSDTLRMELAPLGVTVVIVEPGPVATPIWDKSAQAAGDPDQLQEHYRERAHKLLAAAEQRAASGFPPEVVGRTVVEAATAPKPRARYLTAMDVQERAATWLFPILPGRWVDRLVADQIDKGRGL